MAKACEPHVVLVGLITALAFAGVWLARRVGRRVAIVGRGDGGRRADAGDRAIGEGGA